MTNFVDFSNIQRSVSTASFLVYINQQIKKLHTHTILVSTLKISGIILNIFFRNYNSKIYILPNNKIYKLRISHTVIRDNPFYFQFYLYTIATSVITIVKRCKVCNTLCS